MENGIEISQCGSTAAVTRERRQEGGIFFTGFEWDKSLSTSISSQLL